VKDARRNSLWICVYLKSYYVSKIDMWGIINFDIFDTKIIRDT